VKFVNASVINASHEFVSLSERYHQRNNSKEKKLDPLPILSSNTSREHPSGHPHSSIETHPHRPKEAKDHLSLPGKS
jgi:hypothetical protein